MAIDEVLLRTTLETLHARPTPDEAIAVIDVARLAAAADNKSDVGEITTLVTLQKLLANMTGHEELPLSAARIDQRRLFEIGEQLVPTGARELAFACAYLVMVQDLDVTAEERKLSTALGAALVLDPGRIEQLAAEMEALARSFR
ncbi:MAG: hypothetical protein SFX73_04105 [Kofleriaceae bacterium]|nr:hypothetical protein [Kofleriaceae bacterium]